MVSAVVYLNDAWLPEYGGQLRMYLDEGAAYDVIPTGAAWWSSCRAKFPTKCCLRPASACRLTGWFRRAATSLFDHAERFW